MSLELHKPEPSRREALAGLLGGGGLLLGLSFGKPLRAAVLASPEAAFAFEPNAFLRLATDGSITVFAKHDEMGQGIHTGLAMAICEELEVGLGAVQVLPAPPNTVYNNNAYGIQVTGGSTSTWSSFDQMRQAGAVAREMLIAAAAEEWGVAASSLVARDGVVSERRGGRTQAYAELVSRAASVAVPEEVALKPKEEQRLVGKPAHRVDSPSKVRGTALFSLDKRRPGMLTAMVARSPSFGGRLASFDAREAKRVEGVRAVVAVPSGVAVVADGYWSAFKGREALRTEWAAGAGGAVDSGDLRELYLQKSRTPGLVARSDGDAQAALEGADLRVTATYELPFQAHAPMEPLSCMVELTGDGGAEIVTGSQMLGADHPAVAARLGVDPSLVKMENSLLGGGFGRRANPASDFVLEAVEVALAARSLKAPIKTVWSREDDLRGGWYRPMFVNALEAGVQGGKLVAWRQRVVGQSIIKGTPFEEYLIHDGVDHSSVEGSSDMPHGIPNIQVELHTINLPVPVLWWRSVGHSHTAFAKETFLDECAAAMGRDPVDLRRELLSEHPRLLNVLELAAEKSDWTRKLPAGMGRGIAVHESFKGFAAHVVEASVENGKPKIHRIVIAIDCGPIVNPDQVVAQMEGAAIFALSATLHSGITLTGGEVDQSNFHDFPIVRMNEAPAIEVHLVDSDDEMGGIGEVGVPGVASATCSALSQASGRRIRRLPVGDQLA